MDSSYNNAFGSQDDRELQNSRDLQGVQTMEGGQDLTQGVQDGLVQGGLTQDNLVQNNLAQGGQVAMTGGVQNVIQGTSNSASGEMQGSVQGGQGEMQFGTTAPSGGAMASQLGANISQPEGVMPAAPQISSMPQMPISSGTGDIILQPEKKSKKKLVIGAIAVLVVVIVGVIAAVIALNPSTTKVDNTKALAALDDYAYYMAYGDLARAEDHTIDDTFEMLANHPLILITFQNASFEDKAALYNGLVDKFAIVEKEVLDEGSNNNADVLEVLVHRQEELLLFYYTGSVIAFDNFDDVGTQGVDTTIKETITQHMNYGNGDSYTTSLFYTLNNYAESEMSEIQISNLMGQVNSVYRTMVTELRSLYDNLKENE